VVGDIASFDGRPRSATVRASTACRVLTIGAASSGAAQAAPDILEELFWLQVDRVRSLTDRVTRTHQRAITDPLTRLYNFGFFRERLTLEIERARATGDPLSLRCSTSTTSSATTTPTATRRGTWCSRRWPRS